MERGEILQEILKQPQYTPYSIGDEFIILYAGTHGYLDGVPLTRVVEWESEFMRFMHTSYASITKEIDENGDITSELETELQCALDQFALIWK